MAGAPAGFGEDPPGLGDTAKTNFAGLPVEVPLVIGAPAIAVRVDQDQLLRHGAMIAGGCDGNAESCDATAESCDANAGSCDGNARSCYANAGTCAGDAGRTGTRARGTGSIRAWLKSW